MRFLLVDKIIALEPGKSITAVKNLTLAEEYLADHFPGFPVMPGVMMVEALVQTSAWLMRVTDDFQYSTILLKQARALKFNNFVKPGHALLVSATLQKTNGAECVLKCTGTVDGDSAVSARLTLERFNLRDKNPKLSATDENLVTKMRSLCSQIWSPPNEGPNGD